MIGVDNNNPTAAMDRKTMVIGAANNNLIVGMGRITVMIGTKAARADPNLIVVVATTGMTTNMGIIQA